jgi:PBS lyase HEAT-like repeat
MKKIIITLALTTIACLAAGQILFRAHHDRAVERIVNQANRIGSSALPDLIQALSREDSALESAYIWLCSQLPETISSRLPELQPASDIRLNAAAVVGQLGSLAKPAVPQLIRLLQDDFADANAALSLGQIGQGSQEAIPALMLAIQEQRPQAATALGNMGPVAKAARSVLMTAAANGPEWLRHESALALGKIGDGRAAQNKSQSCDSRLD